MALGPGGAKVNKVGLFLGDLIVWSERQAISNQCIVLYIPGTFVRCPWGHRGGHDCFAWRLGRHGRGDIELGTPFHQYCRPWGILHMPGRAGQVSLHVFIK